MGLKQANLRETLFKSLVTNGEDFWTVSSGTEFYYNQTLPIEPLNVQENGTNLTKGTLGSLAVSEWAWDYTNERVVVRLSDDTDPDTQADDYVKCSEPKEILTVGSSATKTLILNILIGNTDDTNTDMILFITNEYDESKLILTFNVEDTKSFQDKIILLADDKVKLMSNKENTTILVSYKED